MYAFKIVVTVLVILMVLTLAYSGYKSDKNGKIISITMMIINCLSVIAMWG